MTSRAAADRVAVGERVNDLVGSLQATAATRIGFAHLVVMTRTANALGPKFDVSVLLEQAQACSPGKFHHVCRQYPDHSAHRDLRSSAPRAGLAWPGCLS